MSSQLIKPLAKISQIELVGGKALALQKMIQAGFNVPAGFVVTADAFGQMTPQLEAELLKQFDELEAELVAVRSSAVNEDGQAAAWAGQLDTFLNTSRASLVQNLQLCWQSAQSARAQAYAKQKSIETGKVAVVIQKMIQSQVSGVAFSVHPILQDTNKIIIEAGLGLGEAIVSGEITPDTYIVSKQPEAILEKHIAKQTKRLVRDSSGQTTWQELADDGATQKLSNQQILKLSQIVVKLEGYFSYPVDVEWALFKDRFYILQSRPITNLTN